MAAQYSETECIMELESKRAFVTGGGGYVGSILCRRLAERGYSVAAFDIRYPERDHVDEIERIEV